jgi:hypothetical protein
MSKFFQGFSKIKNKLNSAEQAAASKTDGIKMNIKGQRVIQGEGPNINPSTLDKELYRKSSGPPMLNMKTRVKIWTALFGFVLYTYLTYKLIRYRLKADDLDLMEREVYEDVIIKKRLEELNK